MNDQDWLAERFEQHRTRLRAISYRMLGSLNEADDARPGGVAASEQRRHESGERWPSQMMGSMPSSTSPADSMAEAPPDVRQTRRTKTLARDGSRSLRAATEGVEYSCGSASEQAPV